MFTWLSLGLLAGVVIMLGGSSRPDAVQISALRPLTALFLIPALYYLSMAQLRDARVLVGLLGLLVAWMAIQIVPLPPSVWQSLPGREIIAELDRLTGTEGAWRPISFVPGRGWNALASLIVPVTGLLLALSMRANPRMLLLLIAGMGLFDALWGLLQVVSGRSSALYLYAITNRGLPVGLFANENHSAVFSAIILIIVARLGFTSKANKEPVWLRIVYPAAFVIVLLAILVSGSRAGLVTALLSLIASAIMATQLMATKRRRRRWGNVEHWLATHPRTVLLLFGLVLASLVSAFFGLERAPGFEGILAQNPFEDLRAKLWPVLEAMIGIYWLFGIGFGAFEEAYHIYEPAALLFPNYVNQAHNDWAQFVIEGGLPALVILVGALSWIALTMRKLAGHKDSGIVGLVFWGSIFAIIGAASIIDYPLRTPAFQLVAIWLLLTLALERRDLLD